MTGQRGNKGLFVKLLIICSSAVLIRASVMFTVLDWGYVLYTGRLDIIPHLSIEDCIILCWKTQPCKSVSYRHQNLCELNRLESDGANVKLETQPGSIYSTKSNWTEKVIESLCWIRGKAASECRIDSESPYCPEPSFVSDTEVILGNATRVGNKIRFACIISESNGVLHVYPVGVSECQSNKSWSIAWRPCQEREKNYALNKEAVQSSTFAEQGVGPSDASYAVDGILGDPSAPGLQCAHGGDFDGWWYVDMEQEVVVGKVVVYLRPTAEAEWFRGMEFTVSRTKDESQPSVGAKCGFFEGPIASQVENPVTIRCQVPLVGRFVRVTATTGDKVIMCELQVYTKVD